MEPAEPPTWNLFVDGSSGVIGSGVGVVLESPKEIRTDSSLTHQEYTRRCPVQVGQHRDSELLKIVPIEHLPKPSNSRGEEVLWIEGTPLWMQPVVAYLKDQSLTAVKSEAKKLRRRAAYFVLEDDVLYKRGFASSLLRCVGGEEAMYILREIHEGVYGDKEGFSMPHYPQANGQVEAVNKTIKHTLKRKFDALKGAWVDELYHVIWAIRTTSRTAKGETPFSMTYKAEAMSLIEVRIPSYRRIHFNDISNDET
ncbi:uncharacterized protein LOC111368284 [Olea europaea var. sylvestris]|uniref:uncharacterized protein LOC111368284 n=1 Tax=Olea europaea var. sylvestris TaxID=158386 RepID=UPI000C1D01E3|nr:uncharacterized protein LOC111368284 [Olea europaea var. sylvestris]